MVLWSHTLRALWAYVLCVCVRNGFVLHQAVANTLVCAFTPCARCVCVIVETWHRQEHTHMAEMKQISWSLWVGGWFLLGQPDRLTLLPCFKRCCSPLLKVTTPFVSSPWTGCSCSLSRKATPSAGSSRGSCSPARWSTTPELTASSPFLRHVSWKVTSRLQTAGRWRWWWQISPSSYKMSKTQSETVEYE